MDRMEQRMAAVRDHVAIAWSEEQIGWAVVGLARKRRRRAMVRTSQALLVVAAVGGAAVLAERGQHASAISLASGESPSDGVLHFDDGSTAILRDRDTKLVIAEVSARRIGV